MQSSNDKYYYTLISILTEQTIQSTALCINLNVEVMRKEWEFKVMINVSELGLLAHQSECRIFIGLLNPHGSVTFAISAKKNSFQLFKTGRW